MIICFSGTGNSRYVADILQDLLGDELVRLPPGLMRDPKRISMEIKDDRVIWVMPVYGWGVPPLVVRVIKQAKIFSKHSLTHYLVCTCGDDIGNMDKQWRRLIEDRGWKAGSAFSVQMPNTYTFMPGFDVDPETVRDAKLDGTIERVEHIAELIADEDTTTIDVVRGSWPWVKTSIIRPWFNRYKTKTKPFHTNDKCMGCGKCARNCPIGIIEIVNNRPVWAKGHCIMCSRCYHCCPCHAIEYGKATKGKGQYICPNYTLKA